MTAIAKTTGAARVRVRLDRLGLAPENLRADTPADDGIPRLADTILAAGLIYPPVVRPARKGEDGTHLVLDGRRRRFALLELAARGAIAPDAEIECLLAGTRDAQAAAAVLTGTEQAPTHTADVILAIGKLRKARMTTAQISAALGYDELEIKRLEALAKVHPLAIEAFRGGRLSTKQLRLLARLKDPKRQEELARSALDGYFQEYQAQGLIQRGRITADDERVRLVGLLAYRQAGGRVDSDLFAELPDVLLDEPVLASQWKARAEAAALPLADAGLTVFFGEDIGFRAPDGFDFPPHLHVSALPDVARQAFEAARTRIEAAADALESAGDGPPEALIAEWLQAELQLTALHAPDRTVGAVLLAPGGRWGLEASFLLTEAPAVDAPDVYAHDDADEDGEQHDVRAHVPYRPDIPDAEVAVDLAGGGNALHELRTDVATRGLIRALADSPGAALAALVATLFRELTLHGASGGGALEIAANAYSRPQHPAIADLDGEVRRRLSDWRDAYLATGLRPIAWVCALDEAERSDLLAHLVALTLDLREARATSIDRRARAEAGEIAALCEADIVRHWVPGEAFLKPHPKGQLLGMLQAMGAGDTRVGLLKKDELVTLAAREAAARRWAPPELNWPAPTVETDDAETPEAEEGAFDTPAGPQPEAQAPDAPEQAQAA